MQTYLVHHGILGQKWGVRRYQNPDGTLTQEGKNRYYKESNKTISTNNDSSLNIPSGFVFNRVGKSSLDVNAAGSLYVSYGKDDASRYIKSLGPTPLGKLLNNYGDTVQHISTKDNLRLASNEQLATETAKLLIKDSKLLSSFSDSIYSLAAVDYDEDITSSMLNEILKNPSSKQSQKISYALNTLIADPNYVGEAKKVYEHFRNEGYDAIPDIHDIYSGTSSTAMIIINTNKIKIDSTTEITKDVMKEAKSYVKQLEKLKISELIQ